MFDGLHANVRAEAGQYGAEANTVPVITDPVEILLGLEERLAQSETQLQDQLEQVRNRLEKLEHDVEALQGGKTIDVGALERQVAALAGRLLELEDGTR